MKCNNKLAIFDLDGTLIDSIRDITDNINAMLKYFGYKERTVEEVRTFVCFGAKELVRCAIAKDIGEEKLNDCVSYYNNLYTKSDSPKSKVFFGIKKVLKELKKRGYTLVVLSNKPQQTLDKVYNIYLKNCGFQEVVGGSPERKIKPDPSEVEKLLKKYSVEKENAYLIGDGETDVLAAVNANINSVAVLWGYRDETALKKVGATTLIKKPSLLLTILK
ncbi:MAG: HAD family hydrolase [Clostridia bacterium]|nr:HAD family hydrolase [Clostridia bacterium]